MLGALLGVAALQTSEYFGTGKAPEALGSAHPRNAPYQAFLASDEHFVIAAGNDRLWGEVCEAVGLPELRRDDRFADQSLRARNQAALAELLEPRFRQRTAAEWLRELDARGVPCAPINSYPEILNDPQVAHLELVRDLALPNGAWTRTTAFPVAMSDYRFEIYRQPPELGADTEDVFAEWLGAAVRPATTGG
jgi:crotonobetainyl-CoA:carnitine CoA-transferase CaiB-like acyl-CoA transferase